MFFFHIFDRGFTPKTRSRQDDVEIPCSVINVASGHESESNLDRQLLDALEGRETGNDGLAVIEDLSK